MTSLRSRWRNVAGVRRTGSGLGGGGRASGCKYRRDRHRPSTPVGRATRIRVSAIRRDARDAIFLRSRSGHLGARERQRDGVAVPPGMSPRLAYFRDISAYLSILPPWDPRFGPAWSPRPRHGTIIIAKRELSPPPWRLEVQRIGGSTGGSNRCSVAKLAARSTIFRHFRTPAVSTSHGWVGCYFRARFRPGYPVVVVSADRPSRLTGSAVWRSGTCAATDRG